MTASDAVCSSTTDLSAVQSSSGSRQLQTEAGTLVANTPVGVYRHQLRAVREKLRLETARSVQYSAEAQLAKEQLKAETDARTAIQVDRLINIRPGSFHPISSHLNGTGPSANDGCSVGAYCGNAASLGPADGAATWRMLLKRFWQQWV